MAVGGGGYPPNYGQYSGQFQPKVRFDAIGEAWSLFTQQAGVWLGAFCVYLLVLAVPMGVFLAILIPVIVASSSHEGSGEGVGILMLLLGGVAFLVTMFLSLLMYGGAHRMAIKQVRGHSISVGDMFSTKDVFPSLLGTLFLTGMATAFASLLCYVPALIVGGLLMLAVPLVVDQNLGPTEAMSRSWNVLKGDMWNATGFYFLTSLIGGLFAPVTFPLFMLSNAIVYRDFILTPQIPQQPMEYGTYPNNYPPPQG